LAAIGAVLPGAFAAWQTREQLTESRARQATAADRPAMLSHLPPDVADFTGRNEQVARVAEMFVPPVRGSRGTVPIVTIAGKAGVGKTALALHVAHQISRLFPGGQLYTNLRGAEHEALEPAEVLAGFLRELGVAGDDVPESLEDRARMYRARLATRRILVLLDNAADEPQVRPLIPGTPDCAVLITSRSRLSGLPGVHPVSLDVMANRQAIELLTKIIGADRLAAEEESANRIARLCGFLPLALRVAGARLASRPSWRLSWFADRLSDERNRLNLLKVGDMDIRASLALSYESRSDREKEAFRILGLLRSSSFPAWNLAVLANIELFTAEQTVEEIVDAELLEVSGVDAAGLVRYRFHDLLRDYARERLTAEESDLSRAAALGRMVDAYIGLASEASTGIQPGVLQTSAGGGAPPSAVEAVRADPRGWFSSERATLVSLVEQASEARLWDATWRLAEPLTAMFNWRADWKDWESTHRIALDAANRASSTLGQAVIQCSLGALYRELGRFDEAIALLTDSVTAFRQIGDDHREAVARRNLGDTYRYNGLLDLAISSFTSSLAVFERYSDLRSVADTLGGMADALRGLSRWEDSESRFDRCLSLYRQLGDQTEETRHTVTLAMVYRDRYQNARAETLLRESLEYFARIGDTRWEGQSLRLLGTVLRNEGKNNEAVEHFSRCIRIFEDLLDRRLIAVSLRNRGDAYRLVEHYDKAQTDLSQALSMFTELGDHRWAARTRLSLADEGRRLRQWDTAENNARSALHFSRDIGDQPAAAKALRELGMISRDREDWDTARDYFDQSHAIFIALNDELWVARVLDGLAKIQERRGQDPADLQGQVNQILQACDIQSGRQAVVLAEW
jgi:tetratricopeptide (TPR) repeat protein